MRNDEPSCFTEGSEIWEPNYNLQPPFPWAPFHHKTSIKVWLFIHLCWGHSESEPTWRSASRFVFLLVYQLTVSKLICSVLHDVSYICLSGSWWLIIRSFIFGLLYWGKKLQQTLSDQFVKVNDVSDGSWSISGHSGGFR